MNKEKYMFTVRAYGLLVKDRRALIAFEHWYGKNIFKFPGGGVEIGESPIQALKREILEELHVELKNAELLYIPEKPIFSIFYQNIQVIPIFYTIELKNNNLSIPTLENETPMPELQHNELTFFWVPIERVNQLLTFDSDKEGWTYFYNKFFQHAI